MKTTLEKLLDEKRRCLAAFRQDPTPRLATALRQIQASINYEMRQERRRKVS